MTRSERQWKRLQGRWVLVAKRNGRKIYYRRQKRPTTKLLNAHSFGNIRYARNVLRGIERYGYSTVRWAPQQIKDTELFKEVLK